MSKLVTKNLVVFRYRPYSLYFLGNLVSWIGNSMQFIANSWLALELTGRAYSVAIVLVAYSLPGILLSPIVGVYIDRFDKKWLAAAMDVFRALVLFAVPILWWMRILQPWHLYAMSFLVSLGDVIFTPTISALIREVVPDEVLLYANSFNSVALQIGSVLGAGLGGILVALFSPPIVMIVNALSFLFSALCILGMRKGFVLPMAIIVKGKGFHRFIADLQDGLDYIQQHRDITVKYMIMLFISSTLYTINVLITPFAKNVLHIGVQGFGYMETSFAIGSIAGNMLIPMLALRCGRSRIMTAGLWAMATGLVLLATSPNLWMGLLSYFLLGATFSVWALYFTCVQESVAIDYQGRVYSTFNTFSSIASLVIFLAIGFLSNIVSLRYLYCLQAGLLIIAGVFAYQKIYHQEMYGKKPDAEHRPLVEMK